MRSTPARTSGAPPAQSLWITQGRDPVFQPPSPPQGLLAHPVAGSGASVLREAAAVHVLVTGSLHLVGGVLKLLEPSLSQ